MDGFVLADDALVQSFFHTQQLAASLSIIWLTGIPVHCAITWAISSSSTLPSN
jgi:hypothetical protein